MGVVDLKQSFKQDLSSVMRVVQAALLSTCLAAVSTLPQFNTPAHVSPLAPSISAHPKCCPHLFSQPTNLSPPKPGAHTTQHCLPQIQRRLPMCTWRFSL